MRTKGNACVALAITLVLMTAVGCATGHSASPVTATDLSSLAGTWQGWVRLPTGTNSPATMVMSPGGDYTVKSGAFTTQGQAQIKDGGVVLVSTGGSGSFATSDRASMATLADRSDGTRLLRGTGRDDTAGPFEFEFSKTK